MAIILVLVAMILDFLDGFAARLLNAYSQLGKELDSLADLISFGVAPSLLLYYKVAPLTSKGVALLTLIVVVSAAYRLARFNSDPSQTERFKGLPAPAGALLVVSTLHLAESSVGFYSLFWNPLLYLLLALVTSLLMSCRVEMFSFKGVNWNKIREEWDILSLLIFSLIAALLTLVIGWPLSLWLLLVLLWYIGYNLVFSLFSIKRKK